MEDINPKKAKIETIESKIIIKNKIHDIFKFSNLLFIIDRKKNLFEIEFILFLNKR